MVKHGNAAVDWSSKRPKSPSCLAQLALARALSGGGVFVRGEKSNTEIHTCTTNIILRVLIQSKRKQGHFDLYSSTLITITTRVQGTYHNEYYNSSVGSVGAHDHTTYTLVHSDTITCTHNIHHLWHDNGRTRSQSTFKLV